MNRFRTKKKVGKEDESETGMSFRFRKGKKSQEADQKPELNIATALPSTDEFRTSLLMTGLSARFSMLREQDDPNTKVGKAADDSVLYPKRQSRLMDLGMGGLGDIAEVESIRGPPSFARMDSYASDSDSIKAGSVMSRAKPTEGNVLFGGRQKIYKISAGAASSKTVGAMGGRTLYDDDVAMSAFQKWRHEQRERDGPSEDSTDKDNFGSGTPELEPSRSESPPPVGYNKKRETSSTTSSVSAVGRNSTAATSIASSQPTPSTKDWQSTAPTSASSTPALERNVTRTRRLYETGLNNELHEQQHSALSRMDTLTRQRGIGSRTPDLFQNSPSPTLGAFERFGVERRVLTKGSAPNLRSMSPPATGSSVATNDLGIRVPSAGESRSAFGGSPPLSPPISEAEESMLPIQPQDVGKATSLGVFQKPAQPYDESRFAQRQMQLQQGRETPTQRLRTESNASFVTGRSQSSSSNQRLPLEPKIDTVLSTQPTVKEENPGSFLADDSEDSPMVSPRPTFTTQMPRQRPSDHEHPAFRDDNIPTPLSMTSKPIDAPSPGSDEATPGASSSKQISPEDSPTLGPTAGLSGMVRSHFRTDSDASSIYGGVPQTSGLESRFPAASNDFESLSPWDLEERARDPDWNLSMYSASESLQEKLPEEEEQQRPSNNTRSSGDQFASQLADAQRRVRERLTTYVESDSESRSTSPHRAPENIEQLAPKPSFLGTLRSKSSRGSIVERSRDTNSQSKAMKMLGISTTTMSSSPVHKQSFDEIHSADSDPHVDSDRKSNASNENVHAGIKAFRQARRDLQRMKQLETQSKHQPAQETSPPRPAQRTPPKERAPRQRTPSRERKPPPVFYQRREPSEESRHADGSSVPGSRPGSRAQRDRSESDGSRGSRANSRPPRLRNPQMMHHPEPQLNIQPPTRSPMMPSPGLPGTNIKRSPHMPPQPYPGSPSVGQFNNGSSNGLRAQPFRGYESGQPSPISPMPSPYFNSGPPTPNALPSPRRPSAPPIPGSDPSVPSLTADMKRSVRKKDISDPTFVMSTSRVPTMDLPENTGGRSRSRSRSNSKTAYNPPPVPPINPRRRADESRSRGIFGMDRENMTSSTPNLPMAGSEGSLNSTSSSAEDDLSMGRRQPLRKTPSDTHVMGLGMGPRPVAPPYNVGPPASRMMVTQRPNMGSNGMRMPGGMI